MTDLIVVGGGLAGCEAAWQAAQKGLSVCLYEMRPINSTGAHQTDYLAELVCSNSFGSKLPDRASGLLMAELKRFNSLLLAIAEKYALPAGHALAVDRDLFASEITDTIQSHPNINLIRREVKTIPEAATIIASGPLTSDNLSNSIRTFSTKDHLFFYDAIAPIITSESIDRNITFRASRYHSQVQPDGDYINCPFNEHEYYTFVETLTSADRIPLRSFEMDLLTGVKAGQYFEGCLPVEVIAERGPDTLAFGPMRPVGLMDPRTGSRPYAVVQLRQDDLAKSLYNLVGFQTNLRYSEQERVFRMIPGLEHAEFMRYGQMHRNTFLASPEMILPTLQHKDRPNLFFAGQITGVEGYLGNIATGLLAGLNAVRLIRQEPLLTLPEETMLGALCHYITNASMKSFQPMKANFGILPPLQQQYRGKRERGSAFAARGKTMLENYLAHIL